MTKLNPKVEDISSVVVPAKILSDVLGVSERRIRQLAEEGVLIKTSRGRYNLAESVKNFIIYLKTSAELDDANTARLDLDEERAKHERLKIEKTQLQLKVMKAELHYAGDVEIVMNDMLSNFRAKILALPAKVAPMLLSKNKVADIQDILQKQCYEALEELSNYDPQKFYDDKYIDFEEDIEEGGGGEKEAETEIKK